MIYHRIKVIKSSSLYIVHWTGGLGDFRCLTIRFFEIYHFKLDLSPGYLDRAVKVGHE